jgi:hypothetical protein
MLTEVRQTLQGSGSSMRAESTLVATTSSTQPRHPVPTPDAAIPMSPPKLALLCDHVANEVGNVA